MQRIFPPVDHHSEAFKAAAELGVTDVRVRATVATSYLYLKRKAQLIAHTREERVVVPEATRKKVLKL